MRRGPKPAKPKVEAKPPVVRKPPKDDGTKVRDLEKRLAETVGQLQTRDRELVAAHAQVSESHEQQTATSEILRVISSSLSDLQPMMDTVAEYAARLCEASDAQIFLLEGDTFHLAASHGPLPPARLVPVTRGSVAGRAVIDRQTIHVRDIATEPVGEFPDSLAKGSGWRTVLAEPFLRDGVPIGTIVIRRMEVRPFSDKQLALLKTFADQAVIAIQNVRLFNETKEALEQQTATSEILGVISGSPTDIQPVFEAIAESARRLCDGDFCNVARYDGELVHLAAHAETTPEGLEVLLQIFPARPSRATIFGRAVLEGAVVNIPDVGADAEFAQPLGQALRVRSGLGVPMLREGRAIGVIAIGRKQARPFTDQHVALLKTFADQAVIAIENVRLFNETKEALEQQTATSEILRVISTSPTDVRPVFAAVLASAARLCGAVDATMFRVEGEELHLVAHEGPIPAHSPGQFPLVRGTPPGRVVLDRRTVHVADLQAEPDEFPVGCAYARRLGFRTILGVPLLRGDEAIGAITIRRTEKRPFTDRQEALLQTFADQAVIAIENVRLFTELQEKNRALTQAHAQVTEALDQQTATSEILSVISQSQTDVQPVFDTIVRSAVKLCGALQGNLQRFDGDVLQLVSFYNWPRENLEAALSGYPMRPSRGRGAGRAVLSRAVVQVPDVLEDPEYHSQEAALAAGWRSLLCVPILREGNPIGVISVLRAAPGPFSETHIELLRRFADQALIAIENVRLFKELQARTAELTRSVEQLTALGDVGRTLSSTLDLDTVLQTIVTRASQLAGTDACSVFEYDEATEAFHLRATHNLDEEVVTLARRTPIRRGEGVQGRMAVTRQPVQIPDIAEADAYGGPLRDILLRTGTRAVVAIPMLREDQLIGGLTVNKKTPGEFSPEVIELLKTFATQSALAIQNARLFREIEDKSRQLEVASQHKSEFLANMSHELRTPLNAIIGFSEVLSERMFGELNEKQEEYLKDIYASGTHLLSLINDILDLSKIEAGRMELELSDFDLPTALDNALTLVRERAARRGIALHMNADERLGQMRADERKIRQVVLNLLSNAIKFTPEGGRIEVRAVPVDGSVEVSVTDTGVGIAPEDQEAIFEEFRQVGTAAKKVEGTGLGLTLCRKFVELHGGRIWVTSQVGAGSTFTFRVPVRPGE